MMWGCDKPIGLFLAARPWEVVIASSLGYLRLSLRDDAPFSVRHKINCSHWRCCGLDITYRKGRRRAE